MFKSLEWTEVDNGRRGIDYVAKSPACIVPNKGYSGLFVLYHEDGKYYADWDLTLPADDPEQLKKEAERVHQEFFKSWLK